MKKLLLSLKGVLRNMATRTTTTTKTQTITETKTVTRSSSSNRTVSISIVVAVVITLSSIFAALKAKADEAVNQSDLHCLTLNMYYEAGPAVVQGQHAVAHVTLNRTKYVGFPKTICEVVYEKTVVKYGNDTITVCQFSWTCKKKIVNIAKSAYRDVEEEALKVLSGKVPDSTSGSTNFYSLSLPREPEWTRVCVKTISIGGNQFLRLRRLIPR